MNCREIFSEIDKLYKDYISVWQDVCAIESPTDYKEGLDAVGEYFLEMAEERKWETKVFKQPIAGNVVCITMNL